MTNRMKRRMLFSVKALLCAACLSACAAQPLGARALLGDSISTDTVVVVPVDSFVTAKDTGAFAKKIGWTPGPVEVYHRTFEKAGLTCSTCHHKKNNPNRIKQCARCHKGVAGMDVLHKKCGQCHMERTMDMACTACHKTQEKNTFGADLMRLTFSHKNHYPRQKDCKFCHAEPQMAQWSKKDDFPAMKTCLSCHDNRKSDGLCAVCHTDVVKLKPASHTPWWVGRNGHGLDANYTKQECMQCHSKSECDRCHLGQTSCKIHPPAYRFLHGLDVRMGLVNCAMCHDTKRACSQCHENRR
jgi:hypothetical protein